MGNNYRGKLSVNNGIETKTCEFLFQTTSSDPNPDHRLDSIAATWQSGEFGEFDEDDDGYYFANGSVFVRVLGHAPISDDAYKALKGRLDEH